MIDDPRPGTRYVVGAVAVAVGALRGLIVASPEEGAVIGLSAVLVLLIAALPPPPSVLGQILRWIAFVLAAMPVVLGFAGLLLAVAISPLLYGVGLWVGLTHVER